MVVNVAFQASQILVKIVPKSMVKLFQREENFSGEIRSQIPPSTKFKLPINPQFMYQGILPPKIVQNGKSNQVKLCPISKIQCWSKDDPRQILALLNSLSPTRTFGKMTCNFILYESRNQGRRMCEMCVLMRCY